MRHVRRAMAIGWLVLTYLWDMARDTVSMVRIVVAPDRATAAVLAVDLRTRNPWAISTFANLVSLSPGSVTLDVADDGSRVYVHVITSRSMEEMRADLEDLQRRVLEAVG